MTQSFNVTVTSPVRLALNSALTTNGQFRFTVSGDFGPDYTVQASTNLSAWTTILTTNPPSLPFTWADPMSTNRRQCFYRVLVNP